MEALALKYVQYKLEEFSLFLFFCDLYIQSGDQEALKKLVVECKKSLEEV